VYSQDTTSDEVYRDPQVEDSEGIRVYKQKKVRIFIPTI
jgi:hypothetical protein